jgi:hypothetical protein
MCAFHPKTDRKMPPRPRAYIRRRMLGEPRVSELRDLPWWSDPLVVRVLDAPKLPGITQSSSSAV